MQIDKHVDKGRIDDAFPPGYFLDCHPDEVESNKYEHVEDWHEQGPKHSKVKNIDICHFNKETVL